MHIETRPIDAVLPYEHNPAATTRRWTRSPSR
ncbi:MAG: hypothetical protein JWO31_3913 [Phycisphaerales bacterium]|nr:hypothetical protein [Phycisphaerales bacterium]